MKGRGEPPMAGESAAPRECACEDLLRIQARVLEEVGRIALGAPTLPHNSDQRSRSEQSGEQGQTNHVLLFSFVESFGYASKSRRIGSATAGGVPVTTGGN